jgi:hypothetical protein
MQGHPCPSHRADRSARCRRGAPPFRVPGRYSSGSRQSASTSSRSTSAPGSIPCRCRRPPVARRPAWWRRWARRGRGVPARRSGGVMNVIGAYAEYGLVAGEPAGAPAGRRHTRQAAAVLLQGMTAQYLTTSTYPLKPGDTCLVHARGGRVPVCSFARSRGSAGPRHRHVLHRRKGGSGARRGRGRRHRLHQGRLSLRARGA